MKLGIHYAKDSFSDRWIPYCEQRGIEYKLVDCYASDIIRQLKDCDALLWHHHQAGHKDILFAKQLLFALEQAGKLTFPNFNTAWHFDDKLGQKYLFEQLEIPAATSYVFFSKKEAVDWVEKITFPKVFKLRGGAGSANVQLVTNKNAALSLIHKAFSRGFSKYQAFDNLKERLRRYRNRKTNATDVFKGVLRLIKPPLYAKVGGREIGYVYFQDFIPANSFDIRVIVIGKKAFAIKRMVRDNDFRASGGGVILYDKSLFDESLIKLAFDINEKIASQCLALDFVFDNGKPLVVEISYGFSMAGYDPCPGYWDNHLQWHKGSFNPYGWMIENLLKSLPKQH